MRRLLPLVLVGLGTCLIIAAPLLRFYGYSKLAVAVQNPHLVIDMQATGAHVFDPGTSSEITTDLSIVQKTDGDPQAQAKAPSGTRVWFTTTSTRDANGGILQRSMSRTAFDASTAALKPCCGSFATVVDEAIAKDERSGLFLRFPFNTHQGSYKLWDDALKRTQTVTYKGTTHIDGLTVYRFQETVPATTVGTTQLPAATVGLPGKGQATLDEVYANDRTLYVEPRTGAIINDKQHLTRTLESEGKTVRTVMDADIAYTPAQIKKNVDKYQGRAGDLRMVRSLLPLIFLLAGIVLLGAGLVLRRRGGGSAESGASGSPTDASGADAARQPVGVAPAAGPGRSHRSRS